MNYLLREGRLINLGLVETINRKARVIVFSFPDRAVKVLYDTKEDAISDFNTITAIVTEV